ncbi:hypothetical protein PCL_10701 [Purpureocillium lilacinum]|uniref:Uncharacterized protein n=1 Tax=Purpureocillium lilacinum TaxID=33203 RepID=A0A2U3EC49_PURLI|nr:hypothetical protein PCL_10701 [Purpureocillium lilacinum]
MAAVPPGGGPGGAEISAVGLPAVQNIFSREAGIETGLMQCDVADPVPSSNFGRRASIESMTGADAAHEPHVTLLGIAEMTSHQNLPQAFEAQSADQQAPRLHINPASGTSHTQRR